VKNRIQFAYRFLAALMVATTAAVCATGGAQTPSNAAVGGADQPKTLFITIVEGEGALNDIRTRMAREPIVEVDDENHKPVAGALVLFSLDNAGGSPYATFAGSPTYSVEPDAAPSVMDYSAIRWQSAAAPAVNRDWGQTLVRARKQAGIVPGQPDRTE
jgi:hypothetical protein